LLSGLVRCGVCDAHYVIANRYSYRCGTSRNRGEVACASTASIPHRRLEAVALAALREHLYTPAHLEDLIVEVREEPLRLTRQRRARAEQRTDERTPRELEREIEHIKAAVATGKATPILLEMLEERATRRYALLRQAHPTNGTEERLVRTLERLPTLVASAVEDLRALLAVQQVEAGKKLLAPLVSGIVLHPAPDGTVEAEIQGNVQGLLKLQPPAGGPRAEG
jgi:hypothetical protein